MTSKRQLILVIDDNEVDREAVKRLVLDRYEIMEAATGREGLAVFEQRRPDCVLLDYRLPDVDGIDLLPKLRKRGTAVVMLTGQGNESVAVTALKAGARDYIVKDSLTRETLRLAVGTAIENQSLQNKLERYRLAMERMPLGAMVLRVEGGKVECVATNSAACGALGLSPDQVVSTPLPEVLTGALGAAVIPACNPVLADGHARRLLEWRPGRPGAADEVWDVKLAPLSEAELILTLDNVSERAAADKKQSDTERQLQASQRMEAIGQLAGGVAHDFNNLLTVILGYSDLARLSRKKGPDAESWEQVARAAERAKDLTQQLLAFSRRQIISPKAMRLNDVVGDMAKMLKRLIGEDVELATSLVKEPWTINADNTQIEQVLLNIAVNARDAMPGGGRLLIETANVELDEQYTRTRVGVVPGEYALLAISDTGTGMDVATQQRMFEPFFTTKELGKGTGLGLATVYGIVKQNNGHIAVYSEPGRGTTFKVYWPRMLGAVTSPVKPSTADALPRGDATILLVEDDEQVRVFTATALRNQGYTVIEAPNGVAALDTVGSHSGTIHAVITDVVMPRMGGKALIERLQKINPAIKVLFVSGYTANAIVHHGVLMEGVTFLAKPYTLNELARKIQEVLQGPQS